MSIYTSLFTDAWIDTLLGRSRVAYGKRETASWKDLHYESDRDTAINKAPDFFGDWL